MIFSLRTPPLARYARRAGDERLGDKGAAMAELAHALSEAPQFDAVFQAAFAELLARSRALLRRSKRPAEEVLRPYL